MTDIKKLSPKKVLGDGPVDQNDDQISDTETVNNNKENFPVVRYPVQRTVGKKIKDRFIKLMPGAMKKYNVFSNTQDTKLTPGKGCVLGVIKDKQIKAVISVKGINKTTMSYELIIESKSPKMSSGPLSISTLEKFTSDQIIDRIVNRWISSLRFLSNTSKRTCIACFKDTTEIDVTFGRSLLPRLAALEQVLDEVISKNNSTLARQFMSYINKIENRIYNKDREPCSRFGFESDLSNLFFDGFVNNARQETPAFIAALNNQYPLEKEGNEEKQQHIKAVYFKLLSVKGIFTDGRKLPDTFSAHNIYEFFRDDAIGLFQKSALRCGKDTVEIKEDDSKETTQDFVQDHEGAPIDDTHNDEELEDRSSDTDDTSPKDETEDLINDKDPPEDGE